MKIKILTMVIANALLFFSLSFLALQAWGMSDDQNDTLLPTDEIFDRGPASPEAPPPPPPTGGG
ncbi:MAG: hypothetical protein H6939_12715 [Burkholderiales bacterium]|nr:hypothetical protein [Burkholderiales bacterium]